MTAGDDGGAPGTRTSSGSTLPPLTRTSASFGSRIVVPAPKAEPTKVDNLAAEREAQGYENARLDQEARRKDHGREQSLRDHVHLGTIGLFWTFVLCTGAAAVVFAFHMLTPDAWHFLSPELFAALKGAVAGGLASGLFTEYSRKILRLPPGNSGQS
jgi:hypothetical protein